MTDINTITVQPSTSSTLSTRLLNLKEAIYSVAQANLDSLGGEFTELEKQALLHTEALHQTTSLDLASLLLKGEICNTIINKNLTTAHPAQYASLRALAADQGLSHSELSRAQTCVNVVFPYLQDTLKVNIALMWDSIGKSKIFEMLPHFVVMITGEDSASDNVNKSVAMLREQIEATAEAAGQIIPDDFTRDNLIMGQLLTSAAELPIREMRHHLNPDPTPSIPTTYIQSGETTYFIATLTFDQRRKMEQLLSSHSDPQLFILSDDPDRQAIEAANIPMVASIASLLGGAANG